MQAGILQHCNPARGAEEAQLLDPDGASKTVWSWLVETACSNETS